MSKILIYPFPYSSKNNKYVSLLYSNLSRITGDWAYEIVDCGNNFTKLLKLLSKSKKFHKNIIHIHWVNTVYGSKFLLKSIFLMVFNFSILFFLKTFKGFKIVWTKHNYLSHDFSYPFIDKIGRKIMLGLADKIIVQQKSEYERMKHNDKYVFIPHGNYVNAYGPLSGKRDEVGHDFGFGKDDIVLISLGAVKPYKKLENIIEVFKKAWSVDSMLSMKLLIAGKCDEHYARQLKHLIGDNGNIKLICDFIPDEKIPDYLAIADYSIFWYDESVLTSGGIMLSLSYGVPVIARDIPAADLVRDGENGFLFDNKQELAKIIEKLPLVPKFDKNKIIATVDSLSWNTVSDDFLKLCKTLWKI